MEKSDKDGDRGVSDLNPNPLTTGQGSDPRLGCPWNHGGTWVAGDLLVTVHPASCLVSPWAPLAPVLSLRIPPLRVFGGPVLQPTYAKLASAKGEDSAPSR